MFQLDVAEYTPEEIAGLLVAIVGVMAVAGLVVASFISMRGGLDGVKEMIHSNALVVEPGGGSMNPFHTSSGEKAQKPALALSAAPPTTVTSNNNNDRAAVELASVQDASTSAEPRLPFSPHRVDMRLDEIILGPDASDSGAISVDSLVHDEQIRHGSTSAHFSPRSHTPQTMRGTSSIYGNIA